MTPIGKYFNVVGSIVVAAKAVVAVENAPVFTLEGVDDVVVVLVVVVALLEDDSSIPMEN